MELKYSLASESDIDFISEVYEENIINLHGIHRNKNTWKKLLSNKDSIYYIVHTTLLVGWFRIDIEEDEFWLGMLQVKPMYQHQGIGKAILSIVENIAKEKGFYKIGIHATEDNIAARNLYLSAGYIVTEISPCTTADGIERVGYTFEKILNSNLL